MSPFPLRLNPPLPLAGALCLAMASPGWAAPDGSAAPPAPPDLSAEPTVSAPAAPPVQSADPPVAPDGRRAQLGLHQAMGLGTLGALAATGVVGQIHHWQREAGQPASAVAGLSTAHLALAAVSGAAYLTTAALALTAPAPAAAPAFEGVDSVLVHRGLAVLHAAGIGSTIALGLLSARSDPAFAEAHEVLGFATFGLMSASAAVIAIDF